MRWLKTKASPTTNATVFVNEPHFSKLLLLAEISLRLRSKQNDKSRITIYAQIPREANT